MGNTLIEDKGRVNVMKAFDSYIDQNPELSVRNGILFENKLFKTLSYKCHQQNLIIKVHLMRKQLTLQELYIHQYNLTYLYVQLRSSTNIMPFIRLINFNETNLKPVSQEMELACNSKDYLAVTRQQFYQTLEDRIHSRLTLVMQQFLTLQILHAVKNLHSMKLYHGNIRSSNVLVTSSDHVVLADLASYKPYYLKEDQLGEFRDLFGTSILKCTIAPEKFQSVNEVVMQIMEIDSLPRNLLQALQAMDMFSVGCVIAELFSGQDLFTMESLIQFKKQEYEPQIKIQDGIIRELVQNLIQVDPSKRFSAQEAFDYFNVRYNKFEIIYHLNVCFNTSQDYSPDMRIAIIRKLFPYLGLNIQFNHALPIVTQKISLAKFHQLIKSMNFPKTLPLEEITKNRPDPDCYDLIQNQLIQEFKNAQEQFQAQQHPEVQESKEQLMMSQVQRLRQSIDENVSPSKILRKSVQNLTLIQGQNMDELLIILNMLFNQVRNSRYMQSRLCALEMIGAIIPYQSDTTNFNQIIPQLTNLFDDSESQVICQAFGLFINILSSIKDLNQSEIQLYMLFVHLQMKKVYISEDAFISRYCAEQSSKIAQIIVRYCSMCSVFNQSFHETQKQEFLSYIAERLKRKNNIEAQTLILQNIGDILALFQPKSEEYLQLLISLLNNSELKIFMVQNMHSVYAYYSSNENYGQFIVSCLDPKVKNELLLYHTARFYRLLAEKRILKDEIKIHLQSLAPLLLYPNKWVRDEAMRYVEILFENYSQYDIFVSVRPVLMKFLKEDVAFLNPQILLMLLPEPTPCKLFEQDRKYIPQMYPHISKRELEIYFLYHDQYLSKLRNSGIKEEDDKQAFIKKLDQVKKVSLAAKINDFLLQSFQLLQSEYKNEEDYIIQRDIKNQVLTNKKFQFLSQYALTLTHTQLTASSTNNRNILNSLLIIHEIELKKKQIQFQETISLYKQAPQILVQKQQKLSCQLVTSINEHKDIVSSVDSMGKLFITGSHDMSIKVFDSVKIEQDFTWGSINTFKGNDKITALKVLEGTDSFIAGSNNGSITLYTIDSSGIKQSATFVPGESEIKKIEQFRSDSETMFIYVTQIGGIHIEDIRSRRGVQRFQIGRQRGLVTSITQSKLSTIIGTLNGYVMVYDIRCNLISNVFQLLNHDDQPLPVFSLSMMNRVSQLEGVQSQELLGIGYQSSNNEVGFWDINDLSENLNPQVYLAAADKRSYILQPPKLRNIYKNEQFTNYSNNLQEKTYYDFVGSYHQMDLLSYLRDPLTSCQRIIKEKWLNQTKNVYASLKAAFEAKASVTSLITLSQKTENTLITANSDRTIQSWTLSNDGGKIGERPFERVFITYKNKEQTTNVICSPLQQTRKYIQCKSGDIYCIQDYLAEKQPQKNQESLCHRDCVCDMTYMDQTGLLVSVGRDNVVKVWK